MKLSYINFCRYHVPRSWLQSTGNVIVLFEEMGGNPTKLSFATRETSSICSRVSEAHPLPIDKWTSDDDARKKVGPTLSLECPRPDQVISSIKFASFGTPHGACGSFSHGRCTSSNALSHVKKVRSRLFYKINWLTPHPFFFSSK